MNKKALIFSALFLIIVILAVIVIPKINFGTTPPNSTQENQENNTKDNSSSTNDNDNSVIITLLSPIFFDVELYDNFKIEFEVSAQNYTFEYEFDNTYLTNSNNSFSAIKKGSTNIVLKVTANKSVTNKIIKVNIADRKMSANLQVLKSDLTKTNKIMANTQYFLMLDLFNFPNTDYTISTSENIKNLQQTDTSNLFTFTAHYAKTCTFKISIFDYEKTLILNCFNYTNKINTTFSNSFENNLITLYNFTQLNIEYNKTFFNSTNLQIEKDETTLNSFNAEIADTNIAYIENNTIYAKNSGSTTLTICATDGSNLQKHIDIQVINLAESISHTAETYSIFCGETINFDYTISPANAISCVQIYVDNILQTTFNIMFKNQGTFVITIKDDYTNITKDIIVNVTAKPQNKYALSIKQSQLDFYNATFENNTLTINTDSTAYFSISLKIIGDTAESINLASLVTANSKTLEIKTQTQSNTLDLEIQNIGEGTITITNNQDPSLSITIKIVKS